MEVDEPVAAAQLAVQSDDASCRVCFEKTRELCLQPCNHVVVCEQCWARQRGRQCPVCRVFVHSSVRVYM